VPGWSSRLDPVVAAAAQHVSGIGLPPLPADRGGADGLIGAASPSSAASTSYNSAGTAERSILDPARDLGYFRELRDGTC
jgi:hypothetical protein